MNFKEFKKLVEINTQDAQSKMPNFPELKSLINLGIKKLEDETELEIRTIDVLDTDNDNIPIIDDLIPALIFQLSQMLTNDINLKQKHIMDYEDAKGTFLWNKFKELEMSK